jgi:hypothetical protein
MAWNLCSFTIGNLNIYESAINTVDLQIAKGGNRLANWFNMLADSMAGELPHADDHIA